MGASLTSAEPLPRIASSRRRGNFEYRSVVSTYEPVAEDLFVDRTYFGLTLLGCYLCSWFQDDNGDLRAPMRKFASEMSSGLSLQTNAGLDHLAVDQDALAGSQRGVGVRWRLEDGAVTIRAGRTPLSEPVDVEITDRRLTWCEGDLFAVEADLLGCGFQWYTPMRELGGGNYYASQLYRARGTVGGHRVEGFIGLEQLYGPPGQVYQTSPYFNGIELAWNFFANCYDDGSFECGHLCYGAEHWGFAMIADQNGPVVLATDLEADVVLRPSAYVDRVTYHVPGAAWEFVASERGEMRDLARAREDKYHGQAGVVRRVGDARSPELAFSWVETFPLNGTRR